MRLNGQRDVAAGIDEVRRGLHDPDLLLQVVPRCQELAAVGPDHVVVVLAFETGRLADTYRGMLTIQEARDGLRFTLDAHGPTGSLEVDLRATLTPLDEGTTRVRYVANVTLGGLAARAITPSLDVLGAQLATRVCGDLVTALTESAALV
jgi:carbon monoxide dehydrogenase subunit G